MASRSLQITCSSTLPRPPGRQLVQPLQKILRRLGISHGQWNILLVDDAAMKELHQRHLSDPNTTDVLTFDMRNNKPEMPRSSIELETVLCVDEARRQAKARGHTVTHELLLYAVHSLLHVQGYDDITPEQAVQMHQREDELLRAIGIGPIYHKANGSQNQKSGAAPAIKNQKSPGKERP